MNQESSDIVVIQWCNTMKMEAARSSEALACTYQMALSGVFLWVL
jgi:hypothetical protein